MKYLMITLMFLVSGCAVQVEAQQYEIAKVVPTADSGGSLSGKHFFVSDTNNVRYCVWLNVDNSTTDPTPEGSVSAPAAISANADMNTVSWALADAINSVGTLGYTGVMSASPVDNDEDGNTEEVQIGPILEGNTQDIEDGNSGFEMEVLQQGE